MTASDEDRGAARVHWLAAGRFSAEPRGDFLTVSPAGLEKALAERVPSLPVRVHDRLGAGETRELALEVRGLRTFTLAGVVEAVPELRDLRAMAERPPAPGEVVAAVERIAGPGKLGAACTEALESEDAPAPPRSSAAAAVDAFVKSTAPPPGGPGAGVARRLKQVIEAAVYGTAVDLLRAEPVRSLEASWRGARLLLGECPAGSDMQVELLDAAPEDVARAVRSRPPSDAFDDPDALFVVEPVRDSGVLGGLADLAEEMLAPCIASLAPELLGAASAAELASHVTRGDSLPSAWEDLRAAEASRWLCAVVNPVALFAEGAGAFKRVVFGGSAWAVAAMLSASYRSKRALAAAVGRAGALQAPAGWTIPEGPSSGLRAPTEAFLGLQPVKELAGRGLLALGSVRDTDRVAITAAPMVAAAAGALPLPAQLLTGRIVRFARWTQRQIDADTPPDQVSSIFEQAAQVFLFPGMAGAAALGAQVRGEGKNRVLRVAARVEPSHALVPLSIEFQLPMI